jgi:hypothetical protein
MNDVGEWGRFTINFSGRNWKVGVAREAAEDFLGVRNIDSAALAEWVNLNTAILSPIAERKVACSDHGPDWVKISSADVQFEVRFLEALDRQATKAEPRPSGVRTNS